MHKLKGHKKEVDDVTCHPDTHMVYRTQGNFDVKII